ncbi:related to MNN10 Subunit of mannosyltransferase complex [Cephalotrichum gorgonifer]|uniref:Related to MNN10 Subunit of mannosyltransferase complex n=1 Tax=Cephalotrichum gorgonifer TaxID=2041049 RepID=A0AAE8MNM4_9PEZI|nr:related to MNN10 Subunit of mannosyltransferase complex [Cephalotrichum gorgonifer]
MVAPTADSLGSTSSFNDRKAKSHHRRRSSASLSIATSRPTQGQARSTSQYLSAPPLSPIPGTPILSMPISRSPSPALGGGWSSPGLHTTSGRSSPISNPFTPTGPSQPWERMGPSKTTAAASHSYPANSGRGFIGRHIRKLSSSLPQFRPSQHMYSSTDKPGRETSGKFRVVRGVRSILGRMSRKLKLRALFALFLVLLVVLWYETPLHYYWRRSPHLGGGKKFVIVLGSNVGGGVMTVKGAREWAIERDSLRNKRNYVKRWGYELEVVDMRKRKKYAHEWREGWQKVDYLKAAMRKYPDAEWFWWLDITTLVMEPSYTLQDHIFNNLDAHIYRDINEYNPLNITHPFTDEHLSADDLSPVGDGLASSVNLVLTQDCAGFNLGSFFLRRTDWSLRLLDVWWDPVAYEQRHMVWDHNEQDALEQLYTTQPWVRKHTAFLPQRHVNSFPKGACAEKDKGPDPRFHYDQKDRDFVMNMAGCQWGRDCWGEMYRHRQLSYHLNRKWYERFKEDFIAVIWFKLTGQKVKL